MLINAAENVYNNPQLLQIGRLPLLSFAIASVFALKNALVKEPLLQYLPPPTNGGTVYGSYQNRTVCTPNYQFEDPDTIFDIQRIVRIALNLQTTVRALGSLHSDNDLICTYGIPMNMKRISFFQMNIDLSVTIGAGKEFTDALEELHRHGRSLSNIPAYGGITIGGIIGSGSHGSSLKHPNIADQIIGLIIVDGIGEIQNITKVEDLNAFKANLGFLGIIYSVTIKTVPLYKMRIHNYLESENLLFNGELSKMARNHDFFQFWWFPSEEFVVISKGDYISTTFPGNASTNFMPNMKKIDIFAMRTFTEVFHDLNLLQGLRIEQAVNRQSLYGYSIGKPPIFTEDGFTLINPAVGYGHRLMANRCHNCPWDLYPFLSSLAMDVKETIKAAQTIKEILKESPAEFYMIGIFFRFAARSDGLMTVESGRDTVHIEWIELSRYDPFTQAKAEIAAHQAIIQALIYHHDGRPHWAKNGPYWFTQEFLQRRGNNLIQFREYMQRYDPQGVFLNDFGLRVLGDSNYINWDPREKHCALNDNCICEYDNDCGPGQDVKCIKVYGFNVCQKVETTDLAEYLNLNF